MIWICRNKKIAYGDKPVLMGIVNITPDSFSDGGNYFTAETAVQHGLELLADGADILDLGAQSTRPAYTEVSPEEEWARLSPVLTALRERTDAPLSVDTYFPFVAEKALAAGADIINDVSGTVSEEMAEIVSTYGAGWVIMHSGAGGAKEVRAFFNETAEKIKRLGLDEAQICLDMGIGFGKSYEQNLELLARVKDYKHPAFPLLLGVSRKRVIGRASGQEEPKNRVYGNIAADTAALLGGADLFRLHDIKNEKQGILTAWAIKDLGNRI